MNAAAQPMHTSNAQPELSQEELMVHLERTTAKLETATEMAADLSQQFGQALGWLKDIRKAAGATSPGTTHQELCLLIKDMRRSAIEQGHH